MPTDELPEEVLERFRQSARERLARIEALWARLAQGLGGKAEADELHRQVHTLKGDASLVEFADVELLSQKLEDLVSAAAAGGESVAREVGLSIEMAVGFASLLVRRRRGESLAGIDLDGFVRHVDRALARSQVAAARPADAAKESEIVQEAGRVTAAARGRLAVAATNVYLEYLGASGSSRTRLREVWATMLRELDDVTSTSVVEIAERHVRAMPDLARAVGKRAELVVEIELAARVSAVAADAVDLALLHLLRNAVDHGIEPLEGRIIAGKPEVGRVLLSARAVGEGVEIAVSDDGRGVDPELVRHRAVTAGLLHPDLARDASIAALAELLFLPRFSVKPRADEVSGHGVGLDAVRTAMTQVGGEATLSSTARRGTTVTLSLPRASRRLEVSRFSAYGGRVGIAVPRSWQLVDSRPMTRGDEAIDPLAHLGVRTPNDETGLSMVGMPTLVTLERGDRRIVLAVAGRPEPAVATRICPTADGTAVEVVAIGGAEVLLIRPDRLVAAVTADSDRRPA